MALQARMEASDLFGGLTDDENQAIQKILKQKSFVTGDYVFRENDPGDSLFFVESGVIILNRWITEGDIEKSLLTALPGDLFGEISFMDVGGRSASAFVEQDAEILELHRGEFNTFCKEHAEAGVKILDSLLTLVVERLRLMNYLYVDSLQGELQNTGSHQLNFQHLITSSMWISMDLITGKKVTGRIVQVQKSDAGAEIVIRGSKGELVMVPYHAVISIAFDVKPK